MVKRKLQSVFPVFFTYTIFQTLSTGISIAIYNYGSSDSYFYAFYISNGLSALLGLLIVHELFSYAMRPYVGLRDMARMLFQWAVLFILLISAVVAFSTQGSYSGQMVTAILTMERCVRLLQCGLLLFLLCCSSYLGLSWKSFPIGAAFGFGLVAFSNLIFVGMQQMFHANWLKTFGVIRGSMYDVALVIWLVYSLLPQKVQVRNNLVYRPDIDRWNQAALAVQHAGGAGMGHADVPATYISDIEHAVDRALKNSISH